MVDLWSGERVRPMTADDAAEVAAWRYDGGWSVYDISTSQPLLDNLAGYCTVVNGDKLIGFFCTGIEARIAGMNEEPAILDVGMGMNPKLVGRGNGTRFGETVLEYLAVQHPGVTLRAVVQSWNERSLRLTRRLGFQDTGELTVIQSDRPVTYRVVRRPSHRDSALAVVNHVADRIMRIPQSSPRVAIDGPDGAGKTHFADQLAVVLLNRHHRPVVRISIDGFHNLRAVRYRQGRNSPLGFWADSYNYDRFRRDVLEPRARRLPTFSACQLQSRHRRNPAPRA